MYPVCVKHDGVSYEKIPDIPDIPGMQVRIIIRFG